MYKMRESTKCAISKHHQKLQPHKLVEYNLTTETYEREKTGEQAKKEAGSWKLELDGYPGIRKVIFQKERVNCSCCCWV